MIRGLNETRRNKHMRIQIQSCIQRHPWHCILDGRSLASRANVNAAHAIATIVVLPVLG